MHDSLLIYSFGDEEVQSVVSLVMCEVVRGEEEKVCYVVEVEGKRKQVSVSDSLTHILKSLYGND